MSRSPDMDESSEQADSPQAAFKSYSIEMIPPPPDSPAPNNNDDEKDEEMHVEYVQGDGGKVTKGQDDE